MVIVAFSSFSSSLSSLLATKKMRRRSKGVNCRLLTAFMSFFALKYTETKDKHTIKIINNNNRSDR